MNSTTIYSCLTITFAAILFIYSCQDASEAATDADTTTDVEAAKALLQGQTAGKTVNLGKPTLSAYGFFKDDLKDLNPMEDVIPYDLNTPLFSDYAHKARFFKLPKGKTITYRDKEVLDFPEGTYIIKNFYYQHDETQPSKGRRIIETRLLLRDERVGKPYPLMYGMRNKLKPF